VSISMEIQMGIQLINENQTTSQLSDNILCTSQKGFLILLQTLGDLKHIEKRPQEDET